MSKKFTSGLLDWHINNPRDLPWKEDNDPYKTWVSEIIMQQTRVAQGTPYYLKFIKAFPTIDDLANAEESKVLKLWEGLGYYSRARNMHFTAKYVQQEYKSVFPDTYKEILNLKGIGPYTAAAIASFSFGLSYPVVDGNVLRVISRYFGILKSIDESQTKKQIENICIELIEGTDPAIFNQAIMNFGATQCIPGKPDCDYCKLAKNCQARILNKVSEIPIRTKKVKQRDRYFLYYIISEGDHLFIRQRTGKDIWQGLYEFPMVEKKKELKIDIENDLNDFFTYKDVKISLPNNGSIFKQKLSHQTIYSKFINLKMVAPIILDSNTIKINQKEINKYSFPKTILNYIKSKSLSTLF